jgi:hypothetical protein
MAIDSGRWMIVDKSNTPAILYRYFAFGPFIGDKVKSGVWNAFGIG